MVHAISVPVSGPAPGVRPKTQPPVPARPHSPLPQPAARGLVEGLCSPRYQEESPVQVFVYEYTPRPISDTEEPAPAASAPSSVCLGVGKTYHGYRINFAPRTAVLDLSTPYEGPMLFERRDQVLADNVWVERCTRPTPEQIDRFKQDIQAAQFSNPVLAAFVGMHPELR